MRHLSRRESFARYVKVQGKFRNLHERDVNLKEKKQLVKYEGPKKFCDSFHRFAVEGSAFASRGLDPKD